jgi:transposase-like protein
MGQIPKSSISHPWRYIARTSCFRYGAPTPGSGTASQADSLTTTLAYRRPTTRTARSTVQRVLRPNRNATKPVTELSNVAEGVAVRAADTGHRQAGQLRCGPPAADTQRGASWIKYLNNRAEDSHQPTRRRERTMKRFYSTGRAQRFVPAFTGVSPHFQPTDRVDMNRAQPSK